MISPSLQTTISAPITINGTGIHKGQENSITIFPAPANHGLVFSCCGQTIPLSHSSIFDTEYCTAIGNKESPIYSIEHFCAAVYGLGIDNLMIEVTGNEMPAGDGSAQHFVKAFLQNVLVTLPNKKKSLFFDRRIHISSNDAFITYYPPLAGEKYLYLDLSIDYDHILIGEQNMQFKLSSEAFISSLASARTFGHLKDSERLWKAGKAWGVNLNNCVILGEDALIDGCRLRFTDEFVRHKMLDLLGDLAILGANVYGYIKAHRPGHKINAMFTKELSNSIRPDKSVPISRNAA